MTLTIPTNTPNTAAKKTLNNIVFKTYSIADKDLCLALFDANCPEYFAPNEREDYAEFLASNPAGYEVCLLNDELVGAFGVCAEADDQARLDWILLNPQVQGGGIGSAVMAQVVAQAQGLGAAKLSIATSHKADQFFARKGAHKISETPHGWGPDMHRIDMLLPLQSYKP